MNFLKPKRKFGQNFLTDDSIAKDIVSFLSDSKTKTIIEIGPGKGILTKYLLKISSKEIKFVEIDEECVSYLKNKHPNIEKHLKNYRRTEKRLKLRDSLNKKIPILKNIRFSKFNILKPRKFWWIHYLDSKSNTSKL